MTVSQALRAVITHLKHDHVWRHDTYPWNSTEFYNAKLDIVSGDDMCQGILQKQYKHVVGFFEEHMSGTTNTIHMLFKNSVTYHKYISNIHMLFENSLKYNKYDHNIDMLFKKINNVSKF